ncbi:MAG: hypothetical protein F7B17_01890 [Desulfurococcales archaeon]|nr:hypothetical protein [Desulfurococcales archaeon]
MGWTEDVSLALKVRGYRVSRVVERFRSFEGSIVERIKVVGFSSDGRVKISVVGLEGGLKVSILVSGGIESLHGLAEDAEALGGIVDLDEDSGRLYIVFKSIDVERAGALIESLL